MVQKGVPILMATLMAEWHSVRLSQFWKNLVMNYRVT